MNMLFRCASRLIAVGALTLIVPTFALASDIAPSSSFKLAMGPMSAAQKNQGGTTADAAPAEPHHWHRHRHIHHMRSRRS
jgi:hypothetical protein